MTIVGLHLHHASPPHTWNHCLAPTAIKVCAYWQRSKALVTFITGCPVPENIALKTSKLQQENSFKIYDVEGVQTGYQNQILVQFYMRSYDRQESTN
jgi:hypothetical protein